MRLTDLGWTPERETEFKQYEATDCVPGRVTSVLSQYYRVETDNDSLLALVSGPMRTKTSVSAELPSVGDWVAIEPRPTEGDPLIHSVMKRTSSFSRKVSGKVTDEQVLASNIDTLFIVTGLDRDFNLRRIERYLALAWESGADPVVVLSKADLHTDAAGASKEVQSVAPGAAVLVVSALEGTGLETLEQYLAPGKTIAIIGSSGAGKSTLINKIIGEEVQQTGEVREKDGRGRHVTTRRELIQIPSGALVIDTPGMRELQVWSDGEGLRMAFEDIEGFAAGCRFSDCTHTNEPACAVKGAIESGELDEHRFANYLKLRDEIERHKGRKDESARRAREKSKYGNMKKAWKTHRKFKGYND